MINRRHSSILCLSPWGDCLALLHMQSTQGKMAVDQTATIDLGLSLLTDEPELIGHTIQEKLKERSVRTRDAILLVPSDWLLTVRIEIPEIPEEDLADFVDLQAEQRFSSPIEDLSTLQSVYDIPTDGRGALVMALQQERVNRLMAICRHAGLHLERVSPIAPLFHDASAAESLQLDLVVHPNHIELAAWSGDGLIALRPIASLAGHQPNVDDIASDCVRELRMLMAQFPTIQTYGIDLCDPDNRCEIGPDLEEAFGDVVNEREQREDSRFTGLKIAAQKYLTNSSTLDFLTNQTPSKLQELQHRFGRLGLYAAIGAATTTLLLVGAMLVQYVQLQNLRNRYAAVHPQSIELEQIRNQVKGLSPWFRHRPRNLRILQNITEAFPEHGNVWLTRIEIKNSDTVRLTGKATDEEEWLAMQERLREVENIREIRIHQVRNGDSAPLSFTFSFHQGVGK